MHDIQNILWGIYHFPIWINSKSAWLKISYLKFFSLVHDSRKKDSIHMYMYVTLD